MADFTKKVLVVEDDATLQSVFIDQISKDFSTLDAADGEIAWQKILDHTPDLIVLDLMIPMVNGFELLERIRNHDNPKVANVPILVVSNLASTESIQRAQKFHLVDYIIKSTMSVEGVVKKVLSVLEPEKEVK